MSRAANTPAPADDPFADEIADEEARWQRQARFAVGMYKLVLGQMGYLENGTQPTPQDTVVAAVLAAGVLVADWGRP